MSTSLLILLYSVLKRTAKNMSNGKDFYVELRKQITNLQQGGERAGTYISKRTLLSKVARHVSLVEGSFILYSCLNVPICARKKKR